MFVIPPLPPALRATPTKESFLVIVSLTLHAVVEGGFSSNELKWLLAVQIIPPLTLRAVVGGREWGAFLPVERLCPRVNCSKRRLQVGGLFDKIIIRGLAMSRSFSAVMVLVLEKIYRKNVFGYYVRTAA